MLELLEEERRKTRAILLIQKILRGRQDRKWFEEHGMPVILRNRELGAAALPDYPLPVPSRFSDGAIRHVESIAKWASQALAWLRTLQKVGKLGRASKVEKSVIFSENVSKLKVFQRVH